MPNFDKTGPRGQGPKTGRGMGDCNRGRERGMGTGCGRVRGDGRGLGRGLGRGEDVRKEEEKVNMGK